MVVGFYEAVVGFVHQEVRPAKKWADGALSERALGAVQALVRDLRAAPRVSLAALQVVVREIRRLAQEGPDR